MTDLKCMYCAESGITNTDVFIEIVDVELGAGWICKECFIESEKEKDEHLKELKEALKRKEQECEGLRYEIGSLENDRDILQEQLDQLKKTNENLLSIQYELAESNAKLGQTLTEIKEIAENAYCLTNATNKDMAQFAKQILQKISEVEDEN